MLRIHKLPAPIEVRRPHHPFELSRWYGNALLSIGLLDFLIHGVGRYGRQSRTSHKVSGAYHLHTSGRGDRCVPSLGPAENASLAGRHGDLPDKHGYAVEVLG